MPAIPAITEPLSDGVLDVRLYAERDIPEVLIAYQDDPQLHVRIGLDRPPSGAQLGTQSETADAERAAGERVRLTITQAGSDVCCGRMTAHHFDWENARAELGMWLAPQVRGRGYAPRALRLAARWLFASVGLVRLELLAEPTNAAMLGAADRAGFVHEGVLRAYVRYGKRRLDMAILSLLARDLDPT